VTANVEVFSYEALGCGIIDVVPLIRKTAEIPTPIIDRRLRLTPTYNYRYYSYGENPFSCAPYKTPVAERKKMIIKPNLVANQQNRPIGR
jgi:hypothetical protein